MGLGPAVSFRARVVACTVRVALTLLVVVASGIFLAIAAGVAAPVALADTGSLSGTVTSSPTGLALPDMNVTLWSVSGDQIQSTSTDFSGAYLFAGLDVGQYLVQFSDPWGVYYSTFYNGKATLDDADVVNVSDATTTSGIDAALTYPGDVSGIVSGPDGVLEGISVIAYGPDGSGGWQEVAGATTGSDGSYDLTGLSGGSYKIGFSDPADIYLASFYDGKTTLDAADTVSVSDATTTSGVDATLTRAGDITGTVSGPGGALSDIYVTAYGPDGSGGWQGVSSVVTGSDGSYDLTGLSSGSYKVGFSDPWGVYYSTFYNGKATLDDADVVNVSDATTTSGIDAALTYPGDVSGIVSGPDGVLEGISVIAYGPDGSGGWQEVAGATTGSDGSYDLTGLSGGSYKIGFSDPADIYLASFYDGKTTLDAADTVSVSDATTTSGVDATLTRTGDITGTVSGPGGALSDIYVTAYVSSESGWQQVAGTDTGGDGTYSLTHLAAGTYRVRFRDFSGEYLTQFYAGATTLQSATDITIGQGDAVAGADAVLKAPASLSGVVTGGGSALGGVRVRVYNEVDGAWQFAAGTNTADDGSYTVDGLSPATYRVAFEDPNGTYASQCYSGAASLSTATDIVLGSGDSAIDINAAMAAAAHIQGTVTAYGGATLSDITVNLYGDSDGSWTWLRSATSGAGGAYDLGGLAAGSYRVGFVDDSGVYLATFYGNAGSLDGATSIAVGSAATVKGIDAAMSSAGQISGTVTDGATGVAGIDVTIYKPVADGWVAFADSLTTRTVTMTSGASRRGPTAWDSWTAPGPTRAPSTTPPRRPGSRPCRRQTTSASQAALP